MGHDILGFNQSGEEVAYARFNMWNSNATILYSLLDANNFYAGVSGCGGTSTFSKKQIEKALKKYKHLYKYDDSLLPNDKYLKMDQQQIEDFIKKCLVTAQKEGCVKVYFG
ncbi:hypothetical protein [Bacillus marasmi]|uniref:hypothetical protein n=1 Tax=Bacillus marasmi TaxID=1926279 RepID=UPI00164EA914|nr:hypothetical protein [Bacillus marasmi]